MRSFFYFICFFGWLPQIHALSFAQTIDKVRFSILDDFETGELFAWEVYPYAQDIAFDALFFTRNTPTYKNSNYSIARFVKANDSNELDHGFTKQLNLWTTTDTRVKCAIYFQSDRNPRSLEISLGTFDDRRYFHTIAFPKANRWLEIDIPANEFYGEGDALAAGQHVTVHATRFSLSYDEVGKLARTYFEGSLFSTGDFIVQFSSPATCAVTIQYTNKTIDITVDRSIKMVMTHGRKPTEVFLDGVRHHVWQYDSSKREVSIEVPVGKHQVIIA